VVPKVLPVVWQRLGELTHVVGAAATTGHVAEAILDAIQIMLLLLPWVGSLLVLGMIVQRPARWVVTRCSLFRLHGERS
jgi:hypothetical protein